MWHSGMTRLFCAAVLVAAMTPVSWAQVGKSQGVLDINTMTDAELAAQANPLRKQFVGAVEDRRFRWNANACRGAGLLGELLRGGLLGDLLRDGLLGTGGKGNDDRCECEGRAYRAARTMDHATLLCVRSASPRAVRFGTQGPP